MTRQGAFLWRSNAFYSFSPFPMTRGTAFLVTENSVYESIEFNGDMYPDGYGRFFLHALSKTKTKHDFRKMLLGFNRTAHGYPENEASQLFRWKQNPKEIQFTGRDYFERFFSDWTFWKNARNSELVFRTRGKGQLRLEPGGALAINFGFKSGSFQAV